MRHRFLRSLLSAPAGMFFSMVATGLVGTATVRPAVAALGSATGQYFLAASVALWVVHDARARRRTVSYDYGTFVFFAWMLLAPVYLFQTRGWRGFGPLGWFLLLYLAATLLVGISFLFHG